MKKRRSAGIVPPNPTLQITEQDVKRVCSLTAMRHINIMEYKCTLVRDDKEQALPYTVVYGHPICGRANVSSCANCGWELNEAARRKEMINKEELTYLGSGLRGLVIPSKDPDAWIPA